MLTDEKLIARITNGEGTQPTAAPVLSPGIYWLKTARAGRYYVDATGARLPGCSLESWSVSTWDEKTESPWFLANVHEGGEYDIFADDCGEEWNDKHEPVVRIGPRVEVPEE
jgi:hypothetical protein